MDRSNTSVDIMWSHNRVNRMIPHHLYYDFESIRSYCHNIVSDTDFLLAYRYKTDNDQGEELVLLSNDVDLKTALRVLHNAKIYTLKVFSVEERSDGGGLVVLDGKTYLSAPTPPADSISEVSRNATSPGTSSAFGEEFDFRSRSTPGLSDRISSVLLDESSENRTPPLLQVKADPDEAVFNVSEIQGSTVSGEGNPSPLPVGDPVFHESLQAGSSKNDHQNVTVGLFNLPTINLGSSAADAASFGSIERSDCGRRSLSPNAPTEGYLDSSAHDMLDQEIEGANLFERNGVKAEDIEIDEQSTTVPQRHMELQQDQACSSTSQDNMKLELPTDADTVLEHCYLCHDLGLNPGKIRDLQAKRNHVKKHYRVEKTITPPPEESEEFMKELANCFPSTAVSMGHFEDNAPVQLPPTDKENPLAVPKDTSSHVIGPIKAKKKRKNSKIPWYDRVRRKSSSRPSTPTMPVPKKSRESFPNDMEGSESPEVTLNTVTSQFHQDAASKQAASVDPYEFTEEAGSAQTSWRPKNRSICNVCKSEVADGSRGYHALKHLNLPIARCAYCGYSSKHSLSSVRKHALNCGIKGFGPYQTDVVDLRDEEFKMKQRDCYRKCFG